MNNDPRENKEETRSSSKGITLSKEASSKEEYERYLYGTKNRIPDGKEPALGIFEKIGPAYLQAYEDEIERAESAASRNKDYEWIPPRGFRKMYLEIRSFIRQGKRNIHRYFSRNSS